MTTNPNGANQYILDPRQKMCWELYIKPGTEYFGNAYQSAMKAGYEESSASQITTENWFLEKLRRLNLLGKAEKVLDETLEMNDFVGDKRDSSLTKIKQDTAKFLAERLGKSEGYSTRNELTDGEGNPINLGVVILPIKNATENTLEATTETGNSTS